MMPTHPGRFAESIQRASRPGAPALSDVLRGMAGEVWEMGTTSPTDQSPEDGCGGRGYGGHGREEVRQVERDETKTCQGTSQWGGGAMS